MTAQTLYNQLVQGIISDEKFLYEVRRDQNLTMITKFNSLSDTIQILKNKSIISENKEIKNKYKADKNPLLPEYGTLTIDMVSPYEYSKGVNFELELELISVGQNPPNEESMLNAQRKVLKNLTSDPYYYTRKKMSDEEKKQEKLNQRPEEVTKKVIDAIGKGKKNVIRENVDELEDEESPYSTCDCDFMSAILDELGFSEEDLQDPDIKDEVDAELQRRADMNEALAVKDKMGNIQYAKDDTEASNIIRQAQTKGVQLTKSNV